MKQLSKSARIMASNGSGVLIGLGTAGLTLAIYNGQLWAGIWACVALSAGIALRTIETLSK